MDRLFHDLRYALRTLGKRPRFTLVAVLTLALGIGVNTGIFSVVNGVLFKEVPGLSETEGLVQISRDVGDRYFDMSYPVFTYLREESRTLQDMVAMTPQRMALGEPRAGATEVHFGLVVTGNYFSLLRLRPSAGRFWAADESFYPRVAPSAVISDELWSERFGRDPATIGRTLTLNGHPVEVIGIGPTGFRGHVGGVAIDVFVLMGVQAPGLHSASALEMPTSGIVEVLGRLEDGANREAAAEELSRLGGDFLRDRVPNPPANYTARVESWATIPATVRAGVLAFFTVLMTIVTLVLAMACINVASMLLSRSIERRREMAIRLSMGASRGRIVRQLLTEALVLFLAGGAAGLLLAIWATRLLLLLQPPTPPGIVIELDLSPDWRVFVFSLALSVAAGVVFSLAPALRSTRPDLVPALKEGLAAGPPGRTRVRGVLVAAQMAATLVLLVGAGLFARALGSLKTLDPGWDAAGVHVLPLDLEFSGYDTERGRAFYQQLIERTRALPGVESAALARKIPLGGRSSMGDINVPGVEPPENRVGFPSSYNTVSSDYLETMRLALIEGRDFNETDRSDATRVAIINQAMAERFWPASSPLGQRFYVGQLERNDAFQVIGVVENASYSRLVESTPNFFYLPFSQWHNAQATLHVRTAAGPAPIAAIREAIRRLDPHLPILAAQPLEEALGIFFLPQRLAAWVAGVMGMLALVLGAVGVYGISAFAIGQRTREIGIRLALGARTVEVLRLMIARGLRAPLTGMAVGLAIAVAVTRLLGGFLAGVSPVDPLTYGAVLFLLIGVVLGAVLVPARRAAGVDPAVTLRSE